MNIVFAQQIHRNENIIHIPEHQSPFLGIAILLLDECRRMVSPVTTGVKVVRSVVPIVERKAITLDIRQFSLENNMETGSDSNSPGHQSK